ncbi:MAG: hypothetical protein RLZZ09_2885 [Pseudomonadota bacterium]
MMVEKQGKPRSANTESCPKVFSLTRKDIAALDWAFADDPKPADACLAIYYPKAEQDTLYQSSTRVMSPLIMLGLPASVLVDTLALPFSALAD